MNGTLFWIVNIDLGLVAAAVLFLMPTLWAILAIRRRLHERRSRTKLPFMELKRRPAGESTRIKIISLDEKIDEHIFYLLVLPISLMTSALITKQSNIVVTLILLGASVPWTLVFKTKVIKLLEERRNYQLGFDGERYVGEELSRLITLGFEIYHDVPFDGFNMDHVLVGRQGIFVIETKTRSKPLNKIGDKEYHVEFDGKCLHWPWGTDQEDIKQTSDNAEDLRNWLSGAVGEAVEVSGILTIPGWWVDRTAPNNDIQVLNPKEIYTACDLRKSKLTDEMVQRVCHQLDQKCRVEIK